MKHVATMEAYLDSSDYIDYSDERIQEILSLFQQRSEVERVKAAFTYVRDNIAHSYDINHDEVTRKASEVLQSGHGICYAKSHLLAAILRALGIPSGICYQRVTLYEKPEDGHCIHALNTVYLREFGKWIRLDARGNKEGVNAQFSLDEEKLAFSIRAHYGERDYLLNYAQPHPIIIQTLERYASSMEMYKEGLPESLDEA